VQYCSIESERRTDSYLTTDCRFGHENRRKVDRSSRSRRSFLIKVCIAFGCRCRIWLEIKNGPVVAVCVWRVNSSEPGWVPLEGTRLALTTAL
jgi:hypothetical protein